MNVAIVGVGAVGTACAKSLLLRSSCAEILLLDSNEARARGVANDLSHGEPLCQPTRIKVATYEEFDQVDVILVTAGINEKAGGATDKSDPLGRLRILVPNAKTYDDIIPRIAAVNQHAPIIVVTDPPDPLADIAKSLAPNPVLSTGTYLDSLRFRVQLGRRLGCHPSSVQADVLGEHGTSQVYVWSSATIGSEPISDRLKREGIEEMAFRSEVETAVKFANIDIIEGTGASQHGIGIVTARLTEAIVRDEGLVAPVGTYQEDYGVTLSLPSVIGRNGVSEVLAPSLSAAESAAVRKGAEFVKASVRQLLSGDKS